MSLVGRKNDNEPPANRRNAGLRSPGADQLADAALEMGLLPGAGGGELFDGGGEVVVTDALPGIEQAAQQIPKPQGICIAMEGSTNDVASEHWIFHVSLNN